MFVNKYGYSQPWLHSDLLSLSFVDFLGEDLITCVTSLVILVLGKHFCGVLLIAANFFRSKYKKKL
jgi:hypothetical protein